MGACLVLTLALLGTVPAICPASRQPQRVLTAGAPPELRYAVVNKWRTYSGAQRYCKEVYKGQLASVHSKSHNDELQKLARTYTRLAVWIGAVTSRKASRWETHWEDSSPLNYANWAPLNPLHLVTTCTTLSTRDGLWRSRNCYNLRPFICQY